MKKSIYVILALALTSCKGTHFNQKIAAVNTQKQTITLETSKPKLVVGIVVDQMRYDYLSRFESKFGNGGFKRLINEGFNLKNNHYNYVPTYTAPGHTSIFTGTTPRNHGIVSNTWYDKYEKEKVYCTSDSEVTSVGTTDKAGKMSPHRMLTTTFADQNRLATQFKGKTLGISIKDRGAILPAGHTANGVYWFHGKDEGKFITSSFYRESLPNWVNNFNSSGVVNSYLKPWNTLYDISTYAESGSDLNDFEYKYKGKDTATFPYDLKTLSKTNKGFDILKSTPYGNTLLTDFAIAGIEGEALGQDDITDVLTLSFSATDYVGHYFGVNSKEVEDTYIRLDLQIERFLNYLDSQIGKGNYTVFLTADHGAVQVPNYLKSKRIPSGYFNETDFKEAVNQFVSRKYGTTDIIEFYADGHLFLSNENLEKNKLSKVDVEQSLADFIVTLPAIAKTFTSTQLSYNSNVNGVLSLYQKGYHQKYSGNVYYVLQPSYLDYSHKGSSHGSALNYDTHVPLLFYGNGIRKGATLSKTVVTSIAPTISALLGVSFPNGSSQEVLDFIFK